MRAGPSEPALRALDAIHDRIESPAGKLLRAIEPWSSYVVLPLFALANAGLRWSAEMLVGHERLIAVTVLALVAGKFTGLLLGSALAVWLGVAVKPKTYTWRQLAGAGAVAGIGFTMSLFIAGQALGGGDFAAAKVAIFLASVIGGALGVAILWKRVPEEEILSAATGAEIGTPVL